MSPLLDIAVRTSAVLLAGLAIRAALTRQSAALRHRVLAVTMAGAALVVPASLVTPDWTIALPARTLASVRPSPPSQVAIVTASTARVSAPSPEPPHEPGPRRPIAFLVWAAGCAIGIAFLSAGVHRLIRVAARSRRVTDARWIRCARSIAATYGLRREIVLLQVDNSHLLATWGLRPARVLLPAQAAGWSDDRMRAVLSHELAHVARADWLVQLATQVVLATLWFNPLAWLAARELRRESERACDDAVLGRGIAATDYADHLVALARECRLPSWRAWMPPALPMARRSGFERRISAMLNPRLDRSPLSRSRAAAWAAVLVTITAATAAARVVQVPPSALTGTVYDTTGAVMPGVTVKLEDAQQRGSEATTDASGRFSFPGIGGGHYVLSTAVPGFRSLTSEFDLQTAADWDRAVTLQVGTLQETITVSETRLAPSAPRPAPAAPVRVRVGGNIRAPRKTHDVHPTYPASMRMAGREGKVPIEAVIGADGLVSSVRVLSAQVHPDFAIAAVDAVRQWQFTPTLLNGVAVEVVMTVTVQFNLSN